MLEDPWGKAQVGGWTFGQAGRRQLADPTLPPIRGSGLKLGPHGREPGIKKSKLQNVPKRLPVMQKRIDFLDPKFALDSPFPIHFRASLTKFRGHFCNAKREKKPPGAHSSAPSSSLPSLSLCPPSLPGRCLVRKFHPTSGGGVQTASSSLTPASKRPVNEFFSIFPKDDCHVPIKPSKTTSEGGGQVYINRTHKTCKYGLLFGRSRKNILGGCTTYTLRDSCYSLEIIVG